MRRLERDTLVANCINNETKLECVARGIVGEYRGWDLEELPDCSAVEALRETFQSNQQNFYNNHIFIPAKINSSSSSIYHYLEVSK